MITHPGPGIGFHKRFMWWIIILPTPSYPSAAINLDKNLFGIPVNAAIKIRVLEDFFYPVHDWLPKDFHCLFMGPMCNHN